MNIGEYIAAYIMAPLMLRLKLYNQESSSDEEGNRLERDARQMPRMQTQSPRRTQYKSKTVSRTGGQRGRRG